MCVPVTVPYVEDHATHSVTPDDLALFVGTGRWQQTCVAVPYRNESGRQRAKVWDGAVLSLGEYIVVSAHNITITHNQRRKCGTCM